MCEVPESVSVWEREVQRSGDVRVSHEELENTGLGAPSCTCDNKKCSDLVRSRKPQKVYGGGDIWWKTGEGGPKHVGKTLKGDGRRLRVANSSVERHMGWESGVRGVFCVVRVRE